MYAGAALFLFSCTGRSISSNYYEKHQQALDKIETTYKALYAERPFTLAFTDKKLHTVAVEIITDTLSYIYEFDVQETRLTDTLEKYRLPAKRIIELIGDMQKVRCTWVNNFDYYVDSRERRLIFISIKPVAFRYPFMPTKYYILAYFFEPQNFDAKGRLLDRKDRKRLRKINDAVFRRLTDKICYTIGERFR
jgi:hypothetical protein